LLALNKNDKEIIDFKTDSLSEIAKSMVIVTSRNYMNSNAIELSESLLVSLNQ
jgi:ribosomal silencing factor RsfS